ncbi:hypothetical protein KJ865_12635, partial [Myxococcota bacterium]|nr:hypothetical protein [Myxococcota bacterium]
LTRTNRELQKHIRELERARDEIKTLSGMLPICMHCKNIRDDKGYWSRVESYISRNADVSFSHGICPDCLAKYFPEFPEDE